MCEDSGFGIEIESMVVVDISVLVVVLTVGWYLLSVAVEIGSQIV